MTHHSTSDSAADAGREARWRIRRSQLLTILRMELKRSFLGKRALWIYLVAFAPNLIIGAHALQDKQCNLPEETIILASIVQIYYLRVAIFFASLSLFVRLFRGEIVEKSLHYYFLAPLRREVLVVGKFLAGAVTTVSVFTVGVLVSFALMYGHFEAGRAFVSEGPGLSHLSAYLSATVLACLGYGAVALVIGLIFRNPALPALAFFGWETFNAILPPLLQKLSVTYYLKSLLLVELPVEGWSGLFTVVTEPVSTWFAVTGILTLTGAVVTAACLRARGMEISYSSE